MWTSSKTITKVRLARPANRSWSRHEVHSEVSTALLEVDRLEAGDD
jgi:hypothetical protein